MPRSRFVSISVCALLLTSCFAYDIKIADLTPIVDSVAAASERGPGTSGKLLDLLGDGWKGVAVFDTHSPSSEVANLVGDSAAKEFSALVAQDTSGTILIFQFMHGATQTVFIPHARAAPYASDTRWPVR